MKKPTFLPSPCSALLLTGLVCSSLYLAGCTTAGIVYDMTFPVNKDAVEEQLLQEYADMAQSLRPLKQAVTWIQPRNMYQDCRIIAHPGDEDRDFYWDGKCKDGYASGLGRIMAPDGSTFELVEFNEPGQMPEIFSFVEPDKKYYQYVMPDPHRPERMLETFLRITEGSYGKTYVLSYIAIDSHTYIEDMTSEVVPTKLKVLTRSYPKFKYTFIDFYNMRKSEIAYWYKLVDRRNKDIPGTYQYILDKANTRIAGSIPGVAVQQDRSLQPVFMDPDFVPPHYKIFREIEANTAQAKEAITRAEPKIAEYRKRICSVSPIRPFGKVPHYKDICTEDQKWQDYLAEVKQTEEKWNAQMDARYAAEKQEKQEQYLREAKLRRQQEETRQQDMQDTFWIQNLSNLMQAVLVNAI